MKTAYATAIALVASLAAAPAMAEHPNAISVDHLIKAEGVAKTRAQVVAELQQAQANRDQRPSDQFGRTVAEVSPGFDVQAERVRAATAPADNARKGVL